MKKKKVARRKEINCSLIFTFQSREKRVTIVQKLNWSHRDLFICEKRGEERAQHKRQHQQQ